MTPPATWRTMADSVSAAAIRAMPELPGAVAGYPDLSWTEEDFAWFADRGCAVVRITQHDPPDWESCSVFDYEAGALGPDGFRAGIIARNDFRKDTATAYSDVANLPEVETLLHELEHWAWIAEWPNYPSAEEVAQIRAMLGPKAKLAAIQYRSEQAADVDLSVIIAPDWHPRPRRRLSSLLPEKAMEIPFVSDIRTWVEKSEAEARALLEAHGPELEKLAALAEKAAGNPLLKSALKFAGMSPVLDQLLADLLDGAGAEIGRLVQEATDNGKQAGRAEAAQPVVCANCAEAGEPGTVAPAESG